MKFGVVIHKPTMNLGDDIQTYAAAKLLPHVDYQIDREYISDFKSENDEPVAVIMNAWWMWKMELAACRLYYPQITEHAY